MSHHGLDRLQKLCCMSTCQTGIHNNVHEDYKKSEVLIPHTLCSVTAQIIYNMHFFIHLCLYYCAFFCKITELFIQPLAPFYSVQGRDFVNNWVTTSFSRRILFHKNSRILRRKVALLLCLHVTKQRLECGHILKCVNN